MHRRAAIYLGAALPPRSRDYQEPNGQPFLRKSACAPIPILHRVGFTGRNGYPAGELLPRLSILTAHKRGGISLLHYPWGRPRRTLSGTLPCGARTFLMRMTENSVPHATAWLTHKLYKLFYAYSILPQFSHSTMPSPVATRLTVLVGRDMLQPEHWLFSTFAIGTA
jgi:hypothetical protein